MADILSVIIDGIIHSSYLFIIAVGLTLIYGVMKILNMAHGSLYALGAFTTGSFLGVWMGWGFSASSSYLAMLLAAITVGIVVGPIIERGLLKFMYGKDEVILILVTYAVFLILEDLMKLIWGTSPQFTYINEPYNLLGNVDIGALLGNPDWGISYTVYDLCLVVVAILVGAILTWFLRGTKKGKLLIAVIHDRESSAAQGINVQKFYLITFSVGAMLAAFSGALVAPQVAVVPGMGVEVIVLAFAIVVIGGLGSLPGAALGAIIVSMAQSVAVRYVPQIELFIIYFVMAIVLIVRPKGLFSSVEVRKI